MQPFYNSPDFLRPIRDNNRNEYILVQFHRVLKNTNMSILKNAFDATLKDRDLLELFPNLANYAKMNIDDQYTNTVLFNYPWELVFNLSEESYLMKCASNLQNSFKSPMTSQNYMRQEWKEFFAIFSHMILSKKYTSSLTTSQKR